MIKMITRAIPYLLTAALSAYAAWAWQVNTYERQIAVIQSEYAQAQHRAVEVAHAETIRLAAQAQSAQRTAEARRRSLAADHAGAVSELERLRLAADSASRSCAGATGSDTSPADTASELLGECAAALVDVAGAADQHAVDVRMMLEAWPKPE